MQLLHEIRIAGMQATIWGHAYGSNGRRLGTGADTTRFEHAYPIERGTPPPAPATYPDLPTYEDRIAFNNRYYWLPWRTTDMTAEERLNPLCGRIQTASRNPRFTTALPPETWLRQRLCPDCQRLAPNTTFANELQRDDPWNEQARTINDPRDARMLPDPVTGL
jgi:hypothetical protein